MNIIQLYLSYRLAIFRIMFEQLVNYRSCVKSTS
jgi:hypothetical protein